MVLHEGGLGGLLMENDVLFSRDVFPFKRRKVSAVRDFPAGCGRFAPQISLTQKGDTTSVDGIDNFVGVNGTSDLSKNDSTSKFPMVSQSSGNTDILGKINDFDSKQGRPTVILDQVDRHESIGVEYMPQLAVSLEGSNDVILNSPIKVSELETSEPSKSPHQVTICDLEQRLVPTRRPPYSPTLEGSRDTGFSKLETSKLSEDPYAVHIPAFEEEFIQSSTKLVDVGDGNILEKHLSKDYPPPRKVFAVRHFPPFCGRNAVEKKSLEVVSSSNTKSLGQQRIEEKNNSIQEEKKIHEKKIVEHIQDQDAEKNKLEENELAAACRVQGTQRGTVEKSSKLSRGSNQFHRYETVVTEGNMDAEDLEKKTKKESTFYASNSLKRKFPDIHGSSELLRSEDWRDLEGESRRVIVHCLKAVSNGLDRQDKMLCELNASGFESEFKGKKHGYLEKSNYADMGTNDKSELSGVKSTKVNSTIREVEWHECEVLRKRYTEDVGGLPSNVGKEIVIYTEKIRPEEKVSDVSGSQGQWRGEDYEYSEVESGRVVVYALLAGGNSVGRRGKVSSKLNVISGTSGNKGKKHALTNVDDYEHTVRRKKESKGFGGKSKKMISPTSGSVTHQSSSQLIVLDTDSVEDDEEIDDFHVAARSRTFDLCLPPIGHSDLNSIGNEHDGCVTRNKVRETLRLFQAVCRKLLQEEETKLKDQGIGRRRIDLQAAKILKEKGKYVNVGKHIMGSVPGVEVGDEFHYRVELNIIGLHRQIQGGIDFMKQGQEIIATSIVASGGYADELDNSDFLIYTGQGGNMMGGDKEPEDQKLERGNLALKNSILAKNPVRVIRGFKDKSTESLDARGKAAVVMTYIYDGLYLVEKSWQEEGAHGKLVFKFMLVRVPGQPELAWKQVKKSDKFRVREGLCDDDISGGKEIIPICAVNTIDDEKPPHFEYIRHMIYPDLCRPIPPKGCDCTKKCSESTKCSCAILNGGEIPYNYNGAIVEAKPLVYECGPSCKCPPSCPNRVSQHGIRFQLEIFKTESRGWGVRSVNSISSGSFICEYAGELLEEKEADERTGNDEYLFDIGNNYNDSTLWSGLATLMPDANSSSSEIVEDGFTIDAARYGNIGRFINHSCSPNLYAQDVLYDHDDKRVPHIMFFAAENIPPMQELTYHYNYEIDQVRDSNGNIKKKSCYCGAADCTGRMY